MDSNEQLEKTVSWLTKVGCDVSRLSLDKLDTDVALPLHTFKSRSTQIKEKYNYVFTFRSEPCLDMYNYPDVYKMDEKWQRIS